MFKTLVVNNFRGIKTCSFSDFSRINFFYGKNNSGKSTVLESLFLLSGISTPIILINENNFRNYSRLTESDLESFFHKFDFENQIAFSAQDDDGEERNINIKMMNKRSVTISSAELGLQEIGTNAIRKDYGLSYSFSVGNKISKSFTMKVRENISGFSVSIPSINEYKEKYTTVYLPPTFQFSIILNKLSELIKNKQIKDIIEGLKILSEDVRDITILNNEVYIDIGLPQLVPLKLMGDGMRKILSILVSLYTCKNGAVLIDEIDNGLHYSAISPLIKLLFEVCKIYNVQLFASTHSKEILEQIFNQEEIDLSNFNFYTLFKQNDKTDARLFNGIEAKKAYEQWGLEIR